MLEREPHFCSLPGDKWGLAAFQPLRWGFAGERRHDWRVLIIRETAAICQANTSGWKCNAAVFSLAQWLGRHVCSWGASAMVQLTSLDVWPAYLQTCTQVQSWVRHALHGGSQGSTCFCCVVAATLDLVVDVFKVLQLDCRHNSDYSWGASIVLVSCAAAFILASRPAHSKPPCWLTCRNRDRGGSECAQQLQNSCPRARVPCDRAGTGLIAEDFIEALSLVPGAQLAAVAARSPERVSAARKFADVHGERPLTALCFVCKQANLIIEEHEFCSGYCTCPGASVMLCCTSPPSQS